MQVLQAVIRDGLFFVQTHIEQPPRKSYLRDLAADLRELPQWVRSHGFDKALCAIQADNPRMVDFVTRRGFSFLRDYAHLKIFIRYV